MIRQKYTTHRSTTREWTHRGHVTSGTPQHESDTMARRRGHTSNSSQHMAGQPTNEMDWGAGVGAWTGA